MTGKGYGGLPEEYTKYESSKIVVVPVPYDETSTYGKGADKGPSALIEASAHMELYDTETDSEVYTLGIATDLPVKEKSSPDAMVDATQKRVAEHLKKGKFVVLIGGEHSVSVGSVWAHSEHFKDFSVLQFDAHSDLRESFEGTKFNHACAMARIKEKCPIVQVGIRSMAAEELENMDKSRVFFAEDIYNRKDWMDEAVSKLSKNVYITIDLDFFDPSIMPSTGTPEPGGLFWYDAVELIKKVSAKCNIVGCDVVELCPNKDNWAPDFLASKLIYKILSYKFGGKK